MSLIEGSLCLFVSNRFASSVDPVLVFTCLVVCLLVLQVQVIPWVISDSNYVRCQSQRLDPSKTVFVGALHGMLNAEALVSIMNDLFGGVMYAGIDTDKHKYPIGNAFPLRP